MKIVLEKICIDCQKIKSIKEFPSIKKGKYHRKRCNKCYWIHNKERFARYYRRSKYGFTEKSYQEFLDNHKRKCALCSSDKDLVIDHDHATGDVRGLLCSHCNKGLGYFKDNKEALMKGVKYLEGSFRY